jgi:hypothetical protein
MITSVERVPVIRLIQALSGKTAATVNLLMVRGLTGASTEGARSAMLCPASHLSVYNKSFLPSLRVAVVAACTSSST